jgi:hypothetical protein
VTPGEPVAELLSLPKEYGTPKATLAWEDVRGRLEGGVCEQHFADGELATRLAELSKAKYGYAPSPASYTEQGIWY